MHTFFKILFRFLVFSKGLFFLLNVNSILSSDTIRARVNNLILRSRLPNKEFSIANMAIAERK